MTRLNYYITGCCIDQLQFRRPAENRRVLSCKQYQIYCSRNQGSSRVRFPIFLLDVCIVIVQLFKEWISFFWGLSKCKPHCVASKVYMNPLNYIGLWGARWLSGRVSDSGARGPGFETYFRRVVSLSKTLYFPKVLVNYPGSDGSVPT